MPGREVIAVQVGQCGNQIGNAFWQTIAQEHGIATDGTFQGMHSAQIEKIDVFFHESRSGNFVPRACLTDLENSVLNHVASLPYGRLFRPDNYISNTDGAANNFMNGLYHHEAEKLSDQVLECLRQEVEQSDCCQGFTYTHSASGGTGSGFTMLVHQMTKDLLLPTFGGEFFFTVLPSAQISNTVIEPYNATLCLHRLNDVGNVVCFDNESLYSLAENSLGVSSPTFGDLNRVVGLFMSGCTASFRFRGQLNSDMNKLGIALKPNIFLHYYTPSFAPLTAIRSQRYRKVTVDELVRQMVQEKNMMVDNSVSRQDLFDAMQQGEDTDIDGRCFAYAALFRGEDVRTQKVEEALTHLRGDTTLEDQLLGNIFVYERQNHVLAPAKRSQKYHERNTRPGFSTITEYAPPGMPMSVTYLRNTSSIKHKFLKIIRDAMRLQSTGAFGHWYFDESFSENNESFVALEDVLGYMSSEFIAQFGELDTTMFPQQITPDQIEADMSSEKPTY